MNLTRTRLLLILLGLSGAIFFVLYSGILFIRSREVWLETGDVKLHGQLFLPRWKEGPLPAAVIVHGSDPSTWQDMRLYGWRLAPQGMAVLMYDKRGVGESTGKYAPIGIRESSDRLLDLARDASAWVSWLAAQPEVDPARVGLIGGSQAGWVMPLAAVGNPRVHFIVAISGPAVSYGIEEYYSQLTGDDPGPYRGLNLSDGEIERRLSKFRGPHGYDPIPVLEKLRIPTLWLLGGRDRSVPTFASVANLERIRPRVSGEIEIKIYPLGNHNLQNADTGDTLEYWSDLRRWLRRKGFLGNDEQRPRDIG